MNSSELKAACLEVKKASRILGSLSESKKNEVLGAVHDALLKESDFILAENAKDMERAESVFHLSSSMKERLNLTEKRIVSIAEGVRQVMTLPDPSGRTISDRTLPNGLEIVKTSVPFGTIAMIYESRPNVTVDAAVLCLKSGNACILRGGKEAHFTNAALTQVIQKALVSCNVPKQAVFSILDPSHELVNELLHLRGIIDLVIPRGGHRLIQTVVSNSSVPVIETGSGVCHTYVDKEADLDKAVRIIVNAKVQRPSVCNAMETLLIHKDAADAAVKKVFPELEACGVEIRGDERICSLWPHAVPAVEADWSTEYGDLILSVRVVDSLEEAINHISRYSTHHSECIITENKKNARLFVNAIDAACVYVNASTRFTDGFEFGFGAEIGISTQKLHVRGPMGLEALVTCKYKIFGDGQVRG